MFPLSLFFKKRPRVYPLKRLLAPGRRVALYASQEASDIFFKALELFQLSSLKPAIAAIVSSEPEAVGKNWHGVIIVNPKAVAALNLDAVIIANGMDGSLFQAEANCAGTEMPRCIQAWQWTFADSVDDQKAAGIPWKSIAEGTDKPLRSSNKPPQLTEAVTMEALFKASSDRSVEDILEGYSDPEYVRRHLDRILWIAPREPHPFLGEQLAAGNHSYCCVNSLHMRGKREAVMPKPSGVFRIFLVGASTAFGAGAPHDEQIIGAFIEKYMDRVNRDRGLSQKSIEVFTAAVPQWTSTHERIVIENRVSRLSPDLVITLSGAADIFWTCKGQTVFNVASDWFSEYVSNFNQYLNMMDQPQVAPYPRENDAGIHMEQMAGNLIDNLRLSAFALEQVGCPLLFALQPALIESRKVKSRMESENVEKFEYRCSIENGRVSEGYKFLRDMIPGAGIPNLSFVDLSGVFDNISGETIFLDTFHFGDKGNRIIGEAIGGWVESFLTDAQ